MILLLVFCSRHLSLKKIVIFISNIYHFNNYKITMSYNIQQHGLFLLVVKLIELIIATVHEIKSVFIFYILINF
jgi:hypothetical protein